MSLREKHSGDTFMITFGVSKGGSLCFWQITKRKVQFSSCVYESATAHSKERGGRESLGNLSAANVVKDED